MADYLTTDTELASIADAIRTKGGTVAPLVYPQGFIDAIMALPGGGSNDYTVTVSLTNPISPSDFLWCDIKKLSQMGGEPGETIGTISTANGSTTVAVEDGDLIAVVLGGNWGVSYSESNAVSVSGGVSFVGRNYAGLDYLAFSVAGDGTITVDGVDYGD